MLVPRVDGLGGVDPANPGSRAVLYFTTPSTSSSGQCHDPDPSKSMDPSTCRPNLMVTDISGVRNESDENCRLVVELKREAITKVVINNLYQHTQLEGSFNVINLAIDHGRPKTLNLKELINCYIEHRREVVVRRTRFELRKGLFSALS